MLICNSCLATMPLTLAPFATFTIFSLISLEKEGGKLLSTRAFTSLSLISLMTGPLLVFVQVLPSLYQSIACFDRIEKYCTKVPFDMPIEDRFAQNTELSEFASMQTPGSEETVVEFRHATFAWYPGGVPVLHELQFVTKGKSIVAIIGPVGSGKSTLLESALGETVLIEGSLSLPRSKVAYCPQVAWVINDTIRQNITGPLAFDAKWYNFVIWACALERDLEDIPGGDLSRTGSSGVNLSGGQKQRIVSIGIFALR